MRECAVSDQAAEVAPATPKETTSATAFAIPEDSSSSAMHGLTLSDIVTAGDSSGVDEWAASSNSASPSGSGSIFGGQLLPNHSRASAGGVYWPETSAPWPTAALPYTEALKSPSLAARSSRFGDGCDEIASSLRDTVPTRGSSSYGSAGGCRHDDRSGGGLTFYQAGQFTPGGNRAPCGGIWR